MNIEAPKLQVPQRSAATGGSRPATGLLALMTVLLMALLVMQTWALFTSTADVVPVGSAAAGFDADTERAVAMKLEDRNLPAASVEAWRRYLGGAQLDPVEEGKIHFRMGKLMQDAGQFAEAIASYYRAEVKLGGEAGDLTQKMATRVRECMMRLGQYADLTREMASRADMESPAGSLAGRQVVAEIGGEKISVADFDRMLTEQVEQMIAMQVGIGADQAEEIRRQAHAQFADVEARMQQLQQFVASRVLADEARHQGLQESEAFRRQVAETADRLLATRLMLDEIGKRATVTPQDVQRYYEANLSKYAEPARVTIGHVQCDTEDEAWDVIEKARGGEAFGSLAKSYSKDEASKDRGGVIGQAVEQDGDIVPGIGRQQELHQVIMAASKDTVLAVPYEGERGWHAVKIVDRKERRQKSFDEVKEEVERSVRMARREEVSQQYLQELFTTKGVKFYPGAFSGGAVEGPSSGEGKSDDGGEAP